MIASFEVHTEIVQLLLKHPNIDVNAKNCKVSFTAVYFQHVSGRTIDEIGFFK
jgi:hypothetical protein